MEVQGTAASSPALGPHRETADAVLKQRDGRTAWFHERGGDAEAEGAGGDEII